jgi:hypothetical protein
VSAADDHRTSSELQQEINVEPFAEVRGLPVYNNGQIMGVI